MNNQAANFAGNQAPNFAANQAANPAVNQAVNQPANQAEIERKEESKKYTRFVMETMLGGFEQLINRNVRMADPVTRHILFLDKLFCILDFSIPAVEAYFKYHFNDELALDYMIRVKKIIKLIKEEMDSIETWIQAPHYNIDHPVGKKIIEPFKQDFDQRKEKFDEETK